MIWANLPIVAFATLGLGVLAVGTAVDLWWIGTWLWRHLPGRRP